MTLETEFSPGVISSMRKTVKIAREIGVFMIIYGCALVGGMFAMNSRFELLTFATVLVSTGAGMITGVSFAKAIQSKTEGVSDV